MGVPDRDGDENSYHLFAGGEIFPLSTCTRSGGKRARHGGGADSGGETGKANNERKQEMILKLINRLFCPSCTGAGYLAKQRETAVPGLAANGKVLSWYVVTDQVMGGNSLGFLNVAAAGPRRRRNNGNGSALVLEGNVNLDGGGFVSAVSLSDDLQLPPDASKIRLRVYIASKPGDFVDGTVAEMARGNSGKQIMQLFPAFKVTLADGDSSEMRGRHSWTHDFGNASLRPEGGGFMTLEFRIADFRATRMGQPVEEFWGETKAELGRGPNLQDVRVIGFMVSYLTMDGKNVRNFDGGLFGLRVESIEFF